MILTLHFSFFIWGIFHSDNFWNLVFLFFLRTIKDNSVPRDLPHHTPSNMHPVKTWALSKCFFPATSSSLPPSYLCTMKVFLLHPAPSMLFSPCTQTASCAPEQTLKHMFYHSSLCASSLRHKLQRFRPQTSPLHTQWFHCLIFFCLMYILMFHTLLFCMFFLVTQPEY